MRDKKVIIIDGSSYFFRAYFAIGRLSNSKGFPTNAIYGFINMLIRVLEVEKPTKLAIAFDTARPSFRKEIYFEYKDNREAPPEDLVAQIPHILHAVDCFGIKRFEKAGYEADDIIGTVAKRAEKEGYSVEIITGDKDLMQLVTRKVTIYDTVKDKRIDEAGVVEKFGVMPSQITDFLGLMGDSSDNIPGVTGIGEKTAAELIGQFGSLEGIYERISQITQNKRKEALVAERDTAFLSRDLATIRCDVPLEFSWDELDYHGPIANKLQPFLEEFEFHTLMKRFDFKKKEKSFVKGQYETINTEARLSELVRDLQDCKVIAVDTETTSLTIHSSKLVGLSLTGRPGVGYYIPVGHCLPGRHNELLNTQLSQELVFKYVKPLLENGEIQKVGQNIKYDFQILRNCGIELKGIGSDTLIASYLIDPDLAHNLDALAFRYLGHQNLTYEEVTGKGKSQILFSEVPIDKATEYAAEDADVTFRLNELLLPKLEEEELVPLYREIEVPLIEVLADMEYCGVLIDKKKLLHMERDLGEEIGEVRDKIYNISGAPININSPKQLSDLLFKKLKLPVVRKTKTGYSTDERVLLELSEQHEICKLILRSRELNKLKSTYVDGLLQQIHPVTGRVHASFNQAVTSTGRLSSSNPNLQNIPTSGDAKYDIRSVFIARPGSLLLSADYSQVELRLLADMSGDSVLLEAFRNGEDIHEVTAKLIFSKDTISPSERGIAKTINFGVIYGQTPYGLSQQLKISQSEAKTFIDNYFERYPGVKRFLHELAKEAAIKGYTTTRLGRRRYIADLKSQNRIQREMAERAAINAPIQGTAADMIKRAMVNLYRAMRQQGLKSQLILQVHDELVLEVAENEITTVKPLLVDLMESALQLQIPLKVDVSTGKNWSEC